MREHTNNGYGQAQSLKADPAWVDAGPRPDIHRLRVETNFRHSVLVDDPIEAFYWQGVATEVSPWPWLFCDAVVLCVLTHS